MTDQSDIDPKRMMLDRTDMSAESEQLFEQLMRFRPEGMTANAWAVRAGVGRTIWSDLRRHGNPSRRTLAKLLEAAGSSLAEFEALRVGHSLEPFIAEATLAEVGRGWRGATPSPIPLLATSLAGEWGKAGSRIEIHSIECSTIVMQLDRPAALAADRGAFAITMVGESMWPRFRAGRRLLVSPAVPVTVGDDVLVELTGSGALIAELAGRSATAIDLRQFNPDVTFAVEASEAVAIHKIVGEAI